MNVLHLHPTDMVVFASCRLQWWFSSPLQHNLTPKLMPRHFLIGRLFHKAVECWHKVLLGTGDVECAAGMALEQIGYEADRVFSDPDFVYAAKTKPTAGYADDVELVTSMFENFCLWAPGRWHPLPGWIEEPIEVRLKPRVLGFITGKVDAIVEYKGSPWILELKTAGRRYGITPDLEMDLQMGAYLWAVRQIMPEVKGVLRVTAYKNVPKAPQLALDGTLSRRNITTTPELIRKACQKHGLNVGDYQEWIHELEGPDHPCFELMPFSRTDKELEILQRRLYAIYQSMRRPVVYPHAGMLCRWCDFAWPCKALNRGDDWKWIVEEEFKYNAERAIGS